MTAKQKDISKLTVEKGLDQLEKLVEEMESGKVPFDKLVEKYAQGSELVKHCGKLLEEGELTIKKISENNTQEDFDPEAGE